MHFMMACLMEFRMWNDKPLCSCSLHENGLKGAMQCTIFIFRLKIHYFWNIHYFFYFLSNIQVDFFTFFFFCTDNSRFFHFISLIYSQWSVFFHHVFLENYLHKFQFSTLYSSIIKLLLFKYYRKITPCSLCKSIKDFLLLCTK